MRKKNLSVMHDYAYYIAIVCFSIIVLFVLLAYLNFENIKEEREARYIHELSRITGELRESFKYLENSMEFTASKIAALPDGDLPGIVNYLKKSSRFPRLKEDVFTWNLFEFISSNDYKVADSVNGVLKDPVRMDFKNRKWLDICRFRPWRIHFAEPDLGSSGEEDMIPIGYGVYRDAQFLGILSIGFDIEKFARKINNLLSNSNIVFIVVNNQFRVITQSNYHHNTMLEDLTYQLRGEKILEENKGSLIKPLKYKGGFYTHYMRVQYSPYTVIVGDMRVDLKGAFLRDFAPQILQTFSLIMIFLTLLYFLRLKVIMPIVSLSEAAEKISRGEEDVKIPETMTEEMQMLALQLEKLMIYTKDLREAKKQLLNSQEDLQIALKQIETEKRSKELMMSNLAYGLKVPAHKVLNYADYLMNNISKGNPNNPLIKGWKEIANTARYIQTLVLDLLEYTRSSDDKIMLNETNVDILSLINDSIDIVKMFANESLVEIDFKHGDLPMVFADELRLKQIMVNLLTRAINVSSNGAIIFISCFYDSNLSIVIKDQRYLNLENADIKENPFVLNKESIDDESNITFNMAKKFLMLHGCKVKIWNEEAGQCIMFSFNDRRIINIAP
jgi:signal transduction histidine kinase